MIGDDTFTHTSLVFKDVDSGASRIYPLKKLPNIDLMRKRHELGALHASGWMEDTLTFETTEHPELAG
jgi:hypothetical protein